MSLVVFYVKRIEFIIESRFDRVDKFFLIESYMNFYIFK